MNEFDNAKRVHDVITEMLKALMEDDELTGNDCVAAVVGVLAALYVIRVKNGMPPHAIEEELISIRDHIYKTIEVNVYANIIRAMTKKKDDDNEKDNA